MRKDGAAKGEGGNVRKKGYSEWGDHGGKGREMRRH